MASGDQPGSGRDVLEGGSERPLWSHAGRWPLSVVTAALIGLLIGYIAGHHRARPHIVQTATTTVPQHASSARPVIGPPFAQTDATCSIQHGHRLQLGIQIENQTSSLVHITGVLSHEPVPGLHPLTTKVGVCGQRKAPPASSDASTVPAGAATWLTVTVQVLVRCPGPDPVQFRVGYSQANHDNSELLAGFDDLSGVPYGGCARTH